MNIDDEEDRQLNALADARKGGPFIHVSKEDMETIIRGAEPDAPLTERLRNQRTPYIPGALREESAAYIEELEAKIENAGQAMAETQRSWEHRCHAIMAALELDFGGPTPDIPEQDSWYARKMKLADEKILKLLEERKALKSEAAEWKQLVLHHNNRLVEAIKELRHISAELAEANADAERLATASTPHVSPVQTADYGRQLRDHDALVEALAAHRARTEVQHEPGEPEGPRPGREARALL